MKLTLPDDHPLAVAIMAASKDIPGDRVFLTVESCDKTWAIRATERFEIDSWIKERVTGDYRGSFTCHGTNIRRRLAELTKGMNP